MNSWDGDSSVVLVKPKASTVINDGDLMALVSNEAVPFSSLTDTATEAGNQLAASAIFLGISMERRLASDDDQRPLAIKTFGTVEVNVPSGNYTHGQILAACNNAGGDALESQKLKAKATASSVRDGIAVVTRAASSVTKVQVYFKARLGTDSLL